MALLTNNSIGDSHSRYASVYHVVDPVFLVLHWLLGVLILVGNGLTIYVILKNQSLRTQVNSLVIGLSLSDLLFGRCCQYYYLSININPLWCFFGIEGHVALDRNPWPGYNTLLLQLIPGDILSACSHIQFHTL